MTSCTSCNAPFTTSEKERTIIEELSPQYSGKKSLFPNSTQCPQCRHRSRLAFRNEWTMYKRRCSKSQKEIIAVYPEGAPFPVYEQTVWWSDEFNPLEYGREFNFSKGFFEQLSELSNVVPRNAIHNTKSENAFYTNYSSENKNCYLIAGCYQVEDSYYSYRVFHGRDMIDCFDLMYGELCYQCIQSTKLYDCLYCRHCHNSSSLSFCEDCIGCSDCIGCTSLRNARFYIFNKKYSEEGYQAEAAILKSDLSLLQKQFDKFKKSQALPKRYLINCEGCEGNEMVNCKDCIDCSTLKESRDCVHSAFGEMNQDCVDCNFFDNNQHVFDSTNLQENYRVAKCYLVWYCSNVYYSGSCFNSKDLFGCIGMKRNQYCLLNKQYSKEDYEKIIPKVISHMEKTGEWGSYLAPNLTPFAYNETAAFDYYPLSEEKARAFGYRFLNEREMKSGERSLHSDTGCDSCGKQFRIIPQEAAFYQRYSISSPTKCPRCRQLSLFAVARS